MGNVGGDPAKMHGGAATLSSSADKVTAAGTGAIAKANAAAGAAGEAELSAAARRLGAAIGTSLEDLGTQVRLASQLASSAAHDLTDATGG